MIATEHIAPVNSNDLVNEVFGKRLRDLRRQRDLTQAQLGESIGLSRVTIANLENGKQNVQLHQVFAFARVLNVEIALLIPARVEIEDAARYMGRVRSDLLGASDLMFLKLAKIRLTAIAEGADAD